MKLQQVVGIVTGGAVGFGRAFAEKILAAGGRVLITDINATRLEATGQALAAQYGATRITWTPQDVVEASSFHRVFALAATFFQAPVNLLINNAGITGDNHFWDLDAPRSWERVVTIDLTALIRGAQVAIQQFRTHLRGQEGVVINLASAAGLSPVPASPEYAAAKAGVVGFTRSCHHLQKQDNIRVVALAPGFADTAMGQLADREMPEMVKLMGGLLTVDMVVDAFVMALEDESNPGRIIRVVQSGTSYYRYPGDKQLYPTAKL